MLTGRLIRVRFARDRIIPSYIDAAAPEWQEIAERLLVLFRGQEGRTRGELDEDVKETFGSDPQTLVHQGLAKLLEDRCEFEVVSGHPPEQLRELVFREAARARVGWGEQSEAHRPTGDLPAHQWGSPGSPHPTLDRSVILAEVAATLNMTAEAVDHGLFADLKSEQRLVQFKDISAERLLQRYNVALAQAVLLKSTGITIQIRNEPPQRYRQLLRSIKFHRLIAEIEKSDADGFRLHLDGPLSLFSATQKYGLQLALFLPVVLQCRDFELEAKLRWGTERKEKVFRLTPRDGLVSHLPETGMYVPPELAMFAELFRKKIADWEIVEEADVLPLGDGFWVPDFRLVHKATKKTVLLEVLGFWRKSSAEKHLERLRKHAKAPFILAVSDQLHIDDAELADLPAGVHRFKQMPLPDEIARLASELIGPVEGGRG
jgi:predicted nuclease of restriction endonuclease-like RecB superfamily